MKKCLPLFVVALGSATLAYADSYQSAFGFVTDIPTDWLILSQQQLERGVDALNPDDPKFIGFDKHVLQQLLGNVKSGNIEVYFHKGIGAGGFINDINVIQQSSHIPANDAQLKAACNELPGLLARYFGHPISMYRCSLTTINGKNAMLTEFDGALQGTRSIQYQIGKSDSESLVVTGTFTNGTIEKERVAFTHITSSMKF